VLWAKLIVFGAVSFVLILVSALIGFLASQSILTQHHVNVGLSSPDALRAVIGTALFVTASGALCTAFGTIVRATVGGISTFVVLLFVVPPILELLPSSTANAIHPYLPSVASEGIASALQDAHSFSPWGGFALFCGYLVVVIGAAALLLRRRDA
jgi:hypothetical protein